MSLPLLQIDAFADEPYTGNPAVVVILDRPREKAWMQNVAAEMNLSETAFVEARQDGAWDLRWFTPACEVQLCGHATLAAGHALLERGDADGDTVRFETRSGPLLVRRSVHGLEMQLPADPPRAVEPPPGLADAIGAPIIQAGRGMYWLAELADGENVEAVRPDLRKMMAVGVGELIITARGDKWHCDFVSRFFAPGCGIDEDPVTGSAHCTLGPYWARQLGRKTLVGKQISRRSGTVGVRVEDDAVVLTGRAVTVFEGQLLG
ncbi:MAG: PhzF family phenazine biosynthesis protein [Planctomycetota bacterium]